MRRFTCYNHDKGLIPMDNKVICINCEAPQKRVWAPGTLPRFLACRNGHFIFLDRCPECRSLWCTASYGPDITISVLWQDSPVEWSELHSRDNGTELFSWHAAEIRKNLPSLDPEVERLIESHIRKLSPNVP